MADGEGGEPFFPCSVCIYDVERFGYISRMEKLPENVFHNAFDVRPRFPASIYESCWENVQGLLAQPHTYLFYHFHQERA